MTFPVPEQTGPIQRSIAERDRLIVFATAVVSLLPMSLLLRPAIESAWIHLGATFLCSYAAVIGVVMILRARFLTRARAGLWTVRDTSRPIPRKATPAVEQLTAAGFAVAHVAVVTDDSGAVFTKPLVILTRVSTLHVAIVSAHGQQILSELSNGQWLVTATTKVVRHDTVIAQTSTESSPSALVSLHESALSVLARAGVQPIAQHQPMGSVEHLERLEQAVLRRLFDEGKSPRAALLLESGPLLTDDTIGSRSTQGGVTTPVAFHTP